MKANFLALLVAAVSFTAGGNCAECISRDNAMHAGVHMLNEEEGCCPVIVPPGPSGSIIAGFNGFRGNAVIITDWGTCPAEPPGGFNWTVYWGDGTYSSQTETTLGPFQASHQYPKYHDHYNVTVYYCSNPPILNSCCDALTITLETELY
eukprot:Em0014g244a